MYGSFKITEGNEGGLQAFSNSKVYPLVGVSPHESMLSGRLYIWSHQSGFVDLMDATKEERDELFEIGNLTKNALSVCFKPDLFNWASLGNLSRQCHMHLIPRYETPREFAGVTFTDENWNKNYAPYKSDFKVPESVLFQICDTLKETIG